MIKGMGGNQLEGRGKVIGLFWMCCLENETADE